MSLPAFARHWARELGALEASLVQLQGGINNLVYRCGEGTAQHVIKGYAPAAEGERDRMRAEVEFLSFAAQVAPQYVPQLIYADALNRCVVLEHLGGAIYEEGQAPSPADIEAAVDFFRRLNADRETARQHIHLDAAEGFLRLTEHLANVRERVAGMQTDHLPRETRTQARALLHRVQDATDLVASQTTALISKGAVADSIDPEERCVSPSDFGFHNAIRTTTGVKFFDFEFAGWDDPAKAAADFVLQPRVPTGSQIAALPAALDENCRGAVEPRCEVLGRVLRLKWVCIMMAVLQPQRLGQLLTNHPEINLKVLTQQRLLGAAAYLQEETPFGIH